MSIIASVSYTHQINVMLSRRQWTVSSLLWHKWLWNVSKLLPELQGKRRITSNGKEDWLRLPLTLGITLLRGMWSRTHDNHRIWSRKRYFAILERPDAALLYNVSAFDATDECRDYLISMTNFKAASNPHFNQWHSSHISSDNMLQAKSHQKW